MLQYHKLTDAPERLTIIYILGRTKYVIKEFNQTKVHTLQHHNFGYTGNRQILTYGGESRGKTTYSSLDAKYHGRRQSINIFGTKV